MFGRREGFTLVEIAVVIFVIAVLTAIAIAIYTNTTSGSADGRRLADMETIQAALEGYYEKYGRYPYSDYDGPGTWDTPGDGDFISYLTAEGYLREDPEDPSGPNHNYRYYRYGAGAYSCDLSRGAFYVLGVVDMEKSGRPHPDSPGWYPSGSSRN